MSIKEKPLIDAVDNLGPLPGFLFSSPFLAGAFTILMCAVFGAVFLFFQVFGRGVTEPEIVVASIIGGALIGTAAGIIILMLVFLRAIIKKEEPRHAAVFCAGGVCCAIVLMPTLVGVGYLAIEHSVGLPRLQ